MLTGFLCLCHLNFGGGDFGFGSMFSMFSVVEFCNILDVTLTLLCY